MSESGPVTHLYRYAASSGLRRQEPVSGPTRDVLSLATSGGGTEAGPAAHPYFFTGFLTEPGSAAQALIATAAIARAQYHVAAATVRMLRDPVVTSNADRLRFESFSACGGVHARLDLPPRALSVPPVTSGTTNVDFNPPMRAALARAAATASQILLKVGDEEFTAVTETGHVTERKVDLPARWVKGFGEVSALHALMLPVAELAAPDARRFISGLPRTARALLWAVPAGRTLRLAATPRPGAVCLAGPERLAELRPLLRFARKLRVYAASDSGGPDSRGLPAPSAWELTLGPAGARFTLTLSPEPYRGFSGEGALLSALAGTSLADPAQATAEDADLVSILLGWEPVIDLPRLTASAALSEERAAAALATLATSGKVGFDLAADAYFHRELPLGAGLERVHPRLAGARELVAAGRVGLTEDGAMSGDHRVRFRPRGTGPDTCTCPWWGQHRGTRGPCQHVLAARIVLGQPGGAR
jgi:hypothetical protein